MKLKEFDIELSKLRSGPNRYEYSLGLPFFESFSNQSVREALLQVNVELDKSEALINVFIHIQGNLTLDCETCLSIYPQPIQTAGALVVKITDEPAETEDDDMIYLSRNDFVFNIGQHLYDYVMLALPLVRNCGDPGNRDMCDKETLQKLEELSPGHTQDSEPEGDERWNKLKDLFSNN